MKFLNKNNIKTLLIILSFIYGMSVVRYAIFPFYQIRYIKHLVTGQSNTFIEENCERHEQKTQFFSEISKSVDNIFFGDSVVDGFWSENFFNINYTKIASSGCIIECLESIGDNIINLNPKNILVYLGGNDADGQGRLGPTESFKIYKEFILKLLKKNVNVVILGINIGDDSRRNKEYVLELNKLFKEFSISMDITYIPPFESLDFSMNKENLNSLSYDGEHLKSKGYQIWLSYINESLPVKFPKFIQKNN